MAHRLGLIICKAKSQWEGRMFSFLCMTSNIIVDNLLVVSPGNWHSCSQAIVNNLRGDAYEVLQEKSAFTAEDRWRCPKACALVRADTSGGLCDGVTLLQLNVEGLTKAKINVLTHLAQAHAVTAILLQETHYKDRSHLKILGYTLTACTEIEVYGTATFVKHHARWSAIAVCPENSLLEWTSTEVEGVTIINVHKPPSVKMDTTGLPYFSRPCMYVGDFNCHSTTWGYRSTNASGKALEDWASASGLNLLHDQATRQFPLPQMKHRHKPKPCICKPGRAVTTSHHPGAFSKVPA